MPHQFIELKPHPWITTNAFYLSSDRSVIIKCHRPKRRNFRFYQYRVLRAFGYPSPYEFRSEKARCKHERAIYAHWHARGYKVPRIFVDFPLPDSAFAGQYIALEFIDGADLGTVLRDNNLAAGHRLAYIAMLFEECHKRHAEAFADRDRWLIKYDANLRNIIVRDGELFHVDFEAGRIAESLIRGAMREISRYVSEAVKHMGPEYSSAVVSLFIDRYRHKRVIRRIVDKSRSIPTFVLNFLRANGNQVQ